MTDRTQPVLEHKAPLFLSSDQVGRALPFTTAIDALEAGLGAYCEGRDDPPRTVLSVPGQEPSADGELLVMPSAGNAGAGVKLVTIVPDNRMRGLPLIQGIYVLLARGSLTPELLIDGAALTGIRTAAVSALATKHLARPDSTRLVVFGAGTQAAAHVEAMRAVRPIDQVTIVGRSRDSASADRLVARLRAAGIDAQVGEPSAIAAADIVCTCTTSVRPVFDDSAVVPGTHINAIGAYRLDMAELPAETISRARLVVESIEATIEEAGDVVAAIAAGKLPRVGFARTIADLLSGGVARQDREQITIFKSVGIACEDLIVARAIADAVAAEPIGDLQS